MEYYALEIIPALTGIQYRIDAPKMHERRQKVKEVF